jgi:hypothetical protein
MITKNSNDKQIYKLYKMINVGDEITVWGTLGKKLIQLPGLKKYGIYHLTIVIKTIDGYVFSFGISYDIDNDKTVIETPDYQMEYKIINQITTQNNKYLKLIAKKNINKQTLEKLNNIFDNLESTIFSQDYYLMTFNSTILNDKSKKNYKKINTMIINKLDNIKDLYILDETDTNNSINTRNYLLKNQLNRNFLLNNFVFNYDNQKFCALASSRKGNKTVNCASFVEKLLGDLITCTGSSIVTNPAWCHQRRTVKSTPCIDPSKSKLTMKNTHSTNTPMSNTNA